MPISKGVQVDYIMAPVTFNVDRSMSVYITGRVVSDDQTNGTAVFTASLTVPADDLAQIMGQGPTAGKNRIDDLTSAIYAYLVGKGQVPAGVIS